MPRKREYSSSEVKSNSRHNSLRRLSSIASLQTLNLFNRRRRSHGSIGTNVIKLTDSSDPASSNSLLSASTSGSCERVADQGATVLIPPTQVPTNNHLCFPDESKCSIPRSRTSSNLPLPTREKDANKPLPLSHSHGRLPLGMLSSTQLPSPPKSNRKYSTSYLSEFDRNIAARRIPLDRSDTEPLLHPNTAYGGMRTRSTAFKENISLGPVKQSSYVDTFGRRDRFRSFVRDNTNAKHQSWFNSPSTTQRVEDDGFSHPASAPTLEIALPKGFELNERNVVHASRDYDSSPLYRRSKERTPTPGLAIPRWKSQPFCDSDSALQPIESAADKHRQLAVPRAKAWRHSMYGEIRQNRLLSARQAPTPPPSKTLLGADVLGQYNLKETGNRGRSVQAFNESCTQKSTSLSPELKPRSVASTSGMVHHAQSVAYWTGRFSSLNDKYREEDLCATLRSSDDRSDSGSLSDSETRLEAARPQSNVTRMHRAIEHLRCQCATEESRHSFDMWQEQLVALLNIPELRMLVDKKQTELRALSKSCRRAQDETLSSQKSVKFRLSSSRKPSLIDRLLGKK